jgi:hypothetical protein
MSTVKWRRALVGIASADGNDVATIARLVRTILEMYVARLRTLTKKALHRDSDSEQASQSL